MENHDQAFHLWKTFGCRKRILVHVDAHHDLWWTEDPASLNIANFLCRALLDGIVREIYWVVPDRTWDSSLNRMQAVHHLRRLLERYPDRPKRFQIEEDRIRAFVLGKPLQVISLESLPLLEEGVLLDVDLDFFCLPRVTYGFNDAHEKHPWCWPAEFVERLAARRVQTDLATIAYSVEGGYTPLNWKYLGDELALRLRVADPANPALVPFEHMRRAAEAGERRQYRAAEEHYRIARELLPESPAPLWGLALLNVVMGREEVAGRLYRQAVLLDPSYRSPYSNEGFWHLRENRLPAAESEYRQMLALSSEDEYACLGMGWLAVRKERWGEAEEWLRRALSSERCELDASRTLADTLVRQHRYKEAIPLYERSLRLALSGRTSLKSPPATSGDQERLSDPGHFSVYRKLGRLYEREGELDKAASLYQMALAGRRSAVTLRWRLARLYRRQGKEREARRESWLGLKSIPASWRKSLRSVAHGLDGILLKAARSR